MGSNSRLVPAWALALLFAVVLALAGGVVVMAVQMEQSADAATRAEQLATQKAFEAELAAAREEAARHEAAEDEAARERAARHEAAQEQAARERAAREQAAREEAAREEAAREQAAREQAARDEANDSMVITGDITVPDINGALITQVGGYPGQPLTTLDMSGLNRMSALLRSLKNGKTYPCPQGSGGGFGDLVAGAQVTVTDGAGAVLATGALTGGSINIHGCTFTYRLTVPDSEFYQVEVAHRGALTFSRADLAAQGWHVSARL